MHIHTATTSRWGARPVQAALVRAFVFLVPIAASIVGIHFASSIVPVPTGSPWLFLLWWVGLSALATGILILVDRVSRRLLPLVALLKLSLVFPDQAPSRLRTALRSGTVESLEQRVAEARAKGHEADAGRGRPAPDGAGRCARRPRPPDAWTRRAGSRLLPDDRRGAPPGQERSATSSTGRRSCTTSASSGCRRRS